MPVPRKFDRRPPERDTTRINDRIRVPEVRLVGEDGKQIGVIKTSEALAYAQERDLDLVEVAPDARPPVCRVLDYSKFKYEQAQKQKAARRHQQQITIREIKFRPKIAQNDYDTKKGHVSRFLLGKDKVKITIMFRGREVTHPERGTALLDKLATELGDIAVIEQSPLQDGRNMTMMLAPSKAVLAGERDKAGNHVVPPAEAANGTQPDGEAHEETGAASGPEGREDTSAPATTATEAYEKTSGPAGAAAQAREDASALAAEASEDAPAPAAEASEEAPAPAAEASEEAPARAPRAPEPREKTGAAAPEPSDAIA